MQTRANFIEKYNQIFQDLISALDITVARTSNQNEMDRYIVNRLEKIREMALNDDDRAGLRLTRLRMLRDNLYQLKNTRPELFAEFKSEFQEIEHSRYFGWRCEVDTAAFLTRNNTEFTHPDPPDFDIQTPGGSISIECTSAHFSGSDAAVEEKIKHAVSKKSGKAYFGPSTVLIVDLTNIYWNAVRRGEDIRSPQLKEWVKERLNLCNLNIGAVLLVGYTARLQEWKVEHGTDRIDNSPSDALSTFLDQHFPFGEANSSLHWVPPEP